MAALKDRVIVKLEDLAIPQESESAVQFAGSVHKLALLYTQNDGAAAFCLLMTMLDSFVANTDQPIALYTCAIEHLKLSRADAESAVATKPTT